MSKSLKSVLRVLCGGGYVYRDGIFVPSKVAGIKRGNQVIFDSQVGLALVCTMSDDHDRFVDAHLIVPSGPLPRIVTAEVNEQLHLSYISHNDSIYIPNACLPPRAYQVSYNEQLTPFADSSILLGPGIHVKMRNSSGVVSQHMIPQLTGLYPHVALLPLAGPEDSDDDDHAPSVANVRYVSHVQTDVYADSVYTVPGMTWRDKKVTNITVSSWGMGTRGDDIPQRILCCAAPLFAAARECSLKFSGPPVKSLTDVATCSSTPGCVSCCYADDIIVHMSNEGLVRDGPYSRFIRMYCLDSLRSAALYASQLFDDGCECTCPCEPLPPPTEYESEEDDPYSDGCSTACDCAYTIFNPEEGPKRMRSCSFHETN